MTPQAQLARPFLSDKEMLNELQQLVSDAKWWRAWCRDILTARNIDVKEGLLKFADKLDVLRREQKIGMYLKSVSEATMPQQTPTPCPKEVHRRQKGLIGPTPSSSQDLSQEMPLWKDALENLLLVRNSARKWEKHLRSGKLAERLEKVVKSIELLAFDISITLESISGLTKGSVAKPVFPKALETKEWFFGDDHSWDLASGSPLYHQTREDELILAAHCKEIIQELPEKFSMVDLGTGGLNKISILLNEVINQKKSCYYLAIDVSNKSLEQQTKALRERYQQYPAIQIRGYQADIRSAHSRVAGLSGTRYIVSFGSVLLNDEFPSERLQPYGQLLRRHDILHVSQDASNKKHRAKLMDIYGQPEFLKFISQRIHQLPNFNREEWELDHLFIDKPRFHHAYMLKEKGIQDGRMLIFFLSWKLSEEYVRTMSSSQGLHIPKTFRTEGSQMIHYVIKGLPVQPKL